MSRMNAKRAVKNSADKLDKTSADKVAHTFDVRHDACNEHTRTVLVVKRDRQAPDMLLYLHPQIGDQPLACLA